MARTIEKAKKLIESLRSMQEEKTSDYIFPCPRCGRNRMDRNPVRNALSRRADVYICNECGKEEAMLDMEEKPPLPLNEWGMVLGFDIDEEEDDQEY